MLLRIDQPVWLLLSFLIGSGDAATATATVVTIQRNISKSFNFVFTTGKPNRSLICMANILRPTRNQHTYMDMDR